MSMREIKFRAWYYPERKMYYRGYQKLTHILLCENDLGRNEGKGHPVKSASYADCELLECTDIKDIHGQEIYEGDIVKVLWRGKYCIDQVDSVPDMFRSRQLHPLHSLLEKYNIPDDADNLCFEILGNYFEKK